MKELWRNVLGITLYCLHLYTIDLVKMQGNRKRKALKVSRLGSHVLIETNLTKAQDSRTIGKALHAWEGPGGWVERERMERPGVVAYASLQVFPILLHL
jgi:hypothetical protein